MCSPRVVIGGSIVAGYAVPVLREVLRTAARRQREKKSGPRYQRERQRDFSPPLGKTNLPTRAGCRGGRWRWRGRDARRAAGATKRGDEEGYPGWSRWWLGAAASKIHRNHTARLHRRSRHLPPPNRNETARVKHPILLPPSRSCPATRRSNGQVKKHHRRAATTTTTTTTDSHDDERSNIRKTAILAAKEISNRCSCARDEDMSRGS